MKSGSLDNISTAETHRAGVFGRNSEKTALSKTAIAEVIMMHMGFSAMGQSHMYMGMEGIKMESVS